jgi:hypothetical protein
MVPQGCGGLEDAKHLFIRKWLQWVKVAFTSAPEESLPHFLLLDEKMIRMKFKKYIIITCKAIDRNKTLVGIRNMKNVV